MKVWIPFRLENAVLPLNALSGEYYDEMGVNVSDLASIKAFHRKKDAVAHMEQLIKRSGHAYRYKIVAFESVEPSQSVATTAVTSWLNGERT